MLKVIILLALTLMAKAVKIEKLINEFTGDVDHIKVTLTFFRTYCECNNKHYNNRDELNFRYNVFSDNLNKLLKGTRNKDLKSIVKVKEIKGKPMLYISEEDGFGFEMNLNNFADLTNEEFERYYLTPREFFDNDKYIPHTKYLRGDGEEKEIVIIDDDFDPVDEVLKYEQQSGQSNNHSHDFMKNEWEREKWGKFEEFLPCMKNCYVKSREKIFKMEENDEERARCAWTSTIHSEPWCLPMRDISAPRACLMAAVNGIRARAWGCAIRPGWARFALMWRRRSVAIPGMAFKCTLGLDNRFDAAGRDMCACCGAGGWPGQRAR